MVFSGVRRGFYFEQNLSDFFDATYSAYRHALEQKPHALVFNLRGDFVFDRALRLHASLERNSSIA